MPFLTIIFIALGLALDAFAVSVASGMFLKTRRIYHALRIGLSFGFFQFFMPILGWSMGTKARPLFSGIDHWIAFGLLSFIGLKMIYEAVKIEKLEKDQDHLAIAVLLGLSMSTSIDALAVGLSFSFLLISIVFPAIIIGLVTFSMCTIGFFIGNRYGHVFERKAEILGGFILIIIGLKILLEDLM